MAEPPRPALAWMEVLERIEESLAQSLQRAPLPAERAERGPSGADEPLRKLEDRLVRWQACLDQAESNARTAAEQLAEDEGALKDWLERAHKVWERLEEWTGQKTSTAWRQQP
jgi:hypothetical protein